ncbi:MAG: threonine/serine exporter family protein [Clostridia bacterium]|nr:threonine/serine exporter family protein [Clostridia bacterium]
MNFIYIFLVCILVSFFIGISMHAKPWVSFLGGLVGGVGYLVYLICPSPRAGYLLSALVLTLLSEILARLCKMPSNNFLVLGIYPLVPGTALYQTMAYAVQGDYLKALEKGGEALVCIVLMTVSIALVPTVFRIVLGERKKRSRRRLQMNED